LERFSGVGSASSKAANSDFWAGVISVKPLKVLPSAVCTGPASKIRVKTGHFVFL
jgi:hypothetical protein